MSVPEPVKVILVDDHALLRGALRYRLNAEPDIRVVSAVGDADEAIEEALRLRPDVLLMDIDMPGLSCFEAIRILHVRCPETRVILLSAFHNDRYIAEAIAVQSWGYIVKSEPEQAVVDAIRSVMSGMAYYSREVRGRVVIEAGRTRLDTTTPSRASTLSNREIEVLRYAVRGLTYEQIGDTMKISRHTVHRHVARIMEKLDIHDRVALARFAIREGLAEP